MFTFAILLVLLQESAPPAATPAPPAPKTFKLEPGTKVPMSLLNTVSTKHAAEGDRVYLETIFPIMANGRIVIPPGSSVAGTLTRVKRPGRVKGKGELYLRFDQLILPNGVVRDFRSRLGGMDGGSEGFDRNEGKISSDSNKAGEAVAVGTAASTGAALGGWIGGGGAGAGMGAAAGAGAALIGVLLSRGPEAVLSKGTTLEMVLDRELLFQEPEVDFSRAVPGRLSSGGSDAPASRPRSRVPGSRF